VNLKYFSFFLVCSAVLHAESNSTLPSDFFAGALADATAFSDEAGKQRLIDVKSTALTPALAFGSSFKYINNPEKNSLISRKRDGSALDVSLTFTMGLGEYSLFDFAVCAPSLMLMHMRTYNDPNKDFGEEMEAYDVDVQIAGLSLPFVLPHDFTVTLGNTYVVPSQFRNGGNILSYSNTPSLTIARPIALPNGGVLALTSGFSYTFSEGDSPTELLSASEQILKQSGIYDSLLSSMLVNNPANLQNGFGHNLGLSYPMTINDQLTFTPSANYSKMYYDKGSNDGRRDTTYVLGVTASYNLFEWMSVTGLANYTSKETNGNLSPEFKDFVGGITFGFNHSF